MMYSLITFRSVTPAQRGEMLLKNAGYYCSLRRTPRWMQEQGCGYSLQLHSQDVRDAVDLLDKDKISYRKIYLLRDSGTAEEVAL